MNIKTVFLNGDLEEEVYMKQPEGFSSSEGEHLVCKLKKSIYGLKQTSRQWYLKFHDVISSFDFVESIKDYCIYQKSVKQSLVVTSTMEAEFVPCFEASSHGVWFKGFMSGLKLVNSFTRPIKIFCDNSAVVFLAKNNKSSDRNPSTKDMPPRSYKDLVSRIELDTLM
ncbi:Retrovirus-related Pol polyprotein from transposon TNT 1-94-like protein [Drosera capensis]